MKKENIIRVGLLALVLCAASVFFYSLATAPEEPVDAELYENLPLLYPDEEGFYTITAVRDYAVYHSLQEMVESPDYIVMGYFGWGRNDSWNMNRDLENPELENEDLYVEGVLYDFHVLDVLKGEIEEDLITVNFPYRQEIKGVLSDQEVNAQGEITKEATVKDPYSFMVQYEYYVNPFLYNMDRVSLLFLYYNEAFDLYFPSGVPYMATVDAEGQVRLRSDLIVPTEEKREEMAQKRIKNTPSDVGTSNVYRHWTDWEEHSYDSEGGQKIRYIRNAEFVENFLPDTYIEDVLDVLELSPAEQAEALEALETVELPPHPHADKIEKSYEDQRWDD